MAMTTGQECVLYLLLLGVWWLAVSQWQRSSSPYRRRHKQRVTTAGAPFQAVIHKTAPKPPWVRQEVLRLKAHLPHTGCRKLAETFNRLHVHHANPNKQGITVSKSTVAAWVRDHRYEIQVLRKSIKNTPPYPVAFQRVWGMDLTGKTAHCGQRHSILGVIEHASRACLSLTALKDKSSITLLRVLLDSVERYGKPRVIRTDNESVFTSSLFRFGLWLLGIKQQTTELHCPWQNGRIERFFGTLKQALNQINVADHQTLNRALADYRFWYNHIRTHQHLSGCTPAEVWEAKGKHEPQINGEPFYFEAWDGLLRGYGFKPPDG